jgi:uncharacterized protein DUF4412
MKVSALSVAVILGFSVSARGDFTIVQKVEGKGAGNEITLKLKGDKIRVEAPPKVTAIIDGRTGDMITLMIAKKKFLRISGEKTKAISELATKYGGDTAEKTKLTATGKKMTINGYEAEEYVGGSKLFKARYWIAPTFPDSVAIIKQLQAVVPSAWSELAKGMMDYRDLPGFPLRTQVKTGEEEVTSTVTAVSRDPLNDAEFAVPKDFEEMKLPNIQISEDKPEPSPSAKP